MTEAVATNADGINSIPDARKKILELAPATRHDRLLERVYK